MARRIQADVNPALLIWARENAGYSIELAAEQAGVPLDGLVAWESGRTKPSVRQAEILAKLYDRPFSVFLLPVPPTTRPIEAEYRRLPKVSPGGESPELRKVIRRLIHRRRLAISLIEDLGDDLTAFGLRSLISEDTEQVGGRIRAALNVPIEVQFGWPSEYVAFRAWRRAVEELGVIVSQFPGKGLGEIRGTSIIQFPLPVVAVSSREIPLSKPFTLLHELVHLSLAASSQERPAASEKRSEDDWLQVERFCEAAAAAVLMPKEAFLNDRDIIRIRDALTVDLARSVARRFRVTPTAVATRCWRLGVINARSFGAWKESWAAYTLAHPVKPGFGISSPAEKAVTRNGPYFTTLVLSALSSERITSADASSFLGVAFNHVEKLRGAWLSQPAGFATSAID